MIKILATATTAIFVSTSAMAGVTDILWDDKPEDSAGLKALAYTGSGDIMEDEGLGMSIHATPSGSWVNAAEEKLENGEFLAPHWLHGYDNKIYIMVAPHLKNDMGQVLRGFGPDDNFIVVEYNNGDWEAARYDYSKDYVMK